MRNFLKLLNFELNRFMKLYLLLFIVLFVIQLPTVLYHIYRYLNLVKEATTYDRLTPDQFIQNYWKFNFGEVIYSLEFVIPIGISVFALMFYIFFIWYRDWFARNTFIYRLLMLPTNRMNIYFAKLTTVMLTVLGIVAYQIILLILYLNLTKWMIPEIYRDYVNITSIVSYSEYLAIVIPSNVYEFIFAYGLGLAFTVIMFTGILFERSFHWRGIIYGVLYTALMVLIFLLPFIIQVALFSNFYLFFNEALILQIAIVVFIIGLSLMVSNYLIHKKVTV